MNKTVNGAVNILSISVPVIYVLVVLVGLGYRLFIIKDGHFELGNFLVYFLVALFFLGVNRTHKIVLARRLKDWKRGESICIRSLKWFERIPMSLLGGSVGIMLGVFNGIPLACVAVPPVIAVLGYGHADEAYWMILKTLKLDFLASATSSLIFLILIYLIGTVIIHFAIRITWLSHWTKAKELPAS